MYQMAAGQPAGRRSQEIEMSYEFSSTLYSCQRDMLDAIAELWITAHGSNHRDDIDRWLAEMTNTDLAADAIAGWTLDQATDQYPDDPEPSHMSQHDYTASDLAEAFSRFRVERPDLQ